MTAVDEAIPDGSPLEVPVYVPTRHEGLGAVVTLPANRNATVGVLLMAGHARDRTHRNGMFVTLARELARHGLCAMRLDYPGVGNSTGLPQSFDMEAPPGWAVEDASRFLLEHTAVRRIILVGTCFGGRVMLHAAQRISEVDSVVLVASPVYPRAWGRQNGVRRLPGRILRRGLRAVESTIASRVQQQREGRAAPTARKVSRAFAKALAAVMRRGTAYFLYSEDDFTTEEIRFALGRLRPAPDRYTFEVIPGALHGFRTLEAQRNTVDRVASWCTRVAAAETAVPV